MNNRQEQPHNILIVEDDEGVRESINLMLRAHRYNAIDFAHDAEMASNKLAAKNYALILLDIGLPDMNGLKLLEKIKSQFKDEVEVIMLTAWDETKYVIEATQKGAFYYVVKDEEVENLPTIVKRAFEKWEHNLMLRKLQSELNKKVDAIEEMLLTDQKFYHDDLNIEYFNNKLLDKIFEIFKGVYAAGITDTKDRAHFWKRAGTSRVSSSSIQEKSCTECNDPQCFTFKYPIDEPIYIIDDLKKNSVVPQICQELDRDIGIGKISSAIYVPLYTYVLDHLKSGEFDELIKEVKEKTVNKKCIYWIWILFEAPYKDTSRDKDKEKLFLSFFYKLGVALRYVYNLKENLSRHFELQQYQKLEKVTEGIPHDIVPLLGKLTDNINLDKGEHKHDSLFILRKVKKLVESYGDYQNSIKKSEYDFKSTDLLKICKDTVATSYTNAESEYAEVKIEFKFKHDDEKYPLQGDELQLERALRNLIVNAKEAIFVAYKRDKTRSDGKIEIFLDKKPSEYEIIIQDNGIGFPDEKLEKPFEDFFSTKREGIGLGLNIAYEAFKQHGGKITVAKNKQNGTVFHCILPMAQESARG